MAGVGIRAATLADADAWVALRTALWPDLPVGEARAEIAAMAGDATLGTFIAWDGDRAVGLVEASLRAYADGCGPGPVGYVEGWYVVPDRRRSGIGRALVAAAEDWARAQGCREMASDALLDNTDSQAAHGRLGYAEVERVVLYRKDL